MSMFLIHGTKQEDALLTERKYSVGSGFWIILGFLLWFGFFLGAVVLHTLTK